MAYPFLPVNPCCTEVVLNSPCGCSSTIVNGGCNNPCGTNLTASSTIVYDGPALTCTTAEPCDTLNVILQKIDEIICNLLIQINSLNIQVNNITNQILIINNDITNIYNQLGECCTTTTSTSSSSTTTSTTTIHPCENFSLTNTGNTQVPIIITNCDTGEPEAIILNPGDTNICVVTDSPLTVPGTIIVTPNGPCLPPTSSTTTTTSSSTSTSTSSTTTTTTTAIPCECLTFENTDNSAIDHNILYNDCFGNSMEATISANEIINVCGCCGSADDPLVLITVGANCIQGLCPGISTTTTTSTTILPNCSFTGTANQVPDVCLTECLPYFNSVSDPQIFVNINNQVVDLTPYINTSQTLGGNDIANTANKLWINNLYDIYEYNISNICPFGASYNKTIDLRPTGIGAGLTAINDTKLVSSSGINIVEIDVSTTTGIVAVKFPMPLNRIISGDMIYTTANQLVCSYENTVTSDTYITIHDYSTGAILLDINISSLNTPYGLYINAGVLQICDGAGGDIYSLNLVTEALTLVGNAGSQVLGASQNPECAVLDLPPLTTTTTSSSSTSTSTSSTTTTTTTTGAPNITPGSTEFQATGADCVPENYPATINFVAIPNPNNFTSMFSPPVSWSDIEYVEIVTVTPTAGFAVKYNGAVLTPGTQLVPTGAITWANVMEIVRDTFACTALYETWTVKIKLYAYTQLTNTTTFNVGWANQYCPNCTTTTTTTLPPA
jgi:hypothetical protein